MNLQIVLTETFKRAAKKLYKKYPSLVKDLLQLQNNLQENPKQGDLIRENTYKIRLAIKDKGRGKSGGSRVLTYFAEITENQENCYVVLLFIYDKSDINNVAEAFVDDCIKEAIEHLSTLSLTSEISDEPPTSPPPTPPLAADAL